jgi:hypothetical protein
VYLFSNVEQIPAIHCYMRYGALLSLIVKYKFLIRFNTEDAKSSKICSAWKKKRCKALTSARLSARRRPSASPWGEGGPQAQEAQPSPRFAVEVAPPKLYRRAHEVAPSEVHAELVRSRCQSSASSSQGLPATKRFSASSPARRLRRKRE